MMENTTGRRFRSSKENLPHRGPFLKTLGTGARGIVETGRNEIVPSYVNQQEEMETKRP